MLSAAARGILEEISLLVTEKVISIEEVFDGSSRFVKVHLHTQSARIGPHVMVLSSRSAKDSLVESAAKAISKASISSDNLKKNKAICPRVITLVAQISSPL